MSGPSAVLVFLVAKNRAYNDGYSAQKAGRSRGSFRRVLYFGPFAEQGWNEGYDDAEAGRPNIHAPSGSGPTLLQFWGRVALSVGLLALFSYLLGR